MVKILNILYLQNMNTKKDLIRTHNASGMHVVVVHYSAFVERGHNRTGLSKDNILIIITTFIID